MRTVLWLLAVGVAATTAAAVASAARKDFGQEFGKGETATLSGTVETPAGDPDGTGTALIRLNPAEGLVCFKLSVSNIDPATAAHIHKAPAGVPGPVVVPLVAPTSGTSKGCVSADPALISDIVSNPTQYYVNVHNAAFPAGAVRGQLSALSEKPVKPKVIVRTKIVRVCKKGKKK